MTKRKGLMNKLKDDDKVKGQETSSDFLISKKPIKKVEEFEKKRQTIYLKENYIQAIKYKSFVEGKSMTDIFDEMLTQYLSEEEITVGTEKAREL